MPHQHKQAPPPPGRRSIHDPGGTGARFCRNLRIRAEGTLGCSADWASDLRGHWVYRGESGVGSVLILRLRHARRTGQQILVKPSGAPHKTFIFMPRVTANTSPATLPMALVGPRPAPTRLSTPASSSCPGARSSPPRGPSRPWPASWTRRSVSASAWGPSSSFPDSWRLRRHRTAVRATTPRPTTGPGWPADRPRQAPDGTGCADRPLAPGRARRRPAPNGVGCANPRSCRRPAGRIRSGGHHGSHVAGPDPPYVPAQ